MTFMSVHSRITNINACIFVRQIIRKLYLLLFHIEILLYKTMMFAASRYSIRRAYIAIRSLNSVNIC